MESVKTFICRSQICAVWKCECMWYPQAGASFALMPVHKSGTQCSLSSKQMRGGGEALCCEPLTLCKPGGYMCVCIWIYKLACVFKVAASALILLVCSVANCYLSHLSTFARIPWILVCRVPIVTFKTLMQRLLYRRWSDSLTHMWPSSRWFGKKRCATSLIQGFKEQRALLTHSDSYRLVLLRHFPPQNSFLKRDTH